MLLVADKNEAGVRDALAGASHPIAVSRYELSAAERVAIPDEAALTKVVDLGHV